MVSLARVAANPPPVRPLGSPAQQYSEHGPKTSAPTPSNGVLRPAASLGLAGVGAATLKGAIRPNVAGKVSAADDRVKGLDRQIFRETSQYKRGKHEGKLSDLKRQRARAISQRDRIARKAPLAQTPKRRLMRGGVGAATIAGGAMLWPRKPKKPNAPEIPMPPTITKAMPRPGKRHVVPAAALLGAGATGWLIGTAKPRRRGYRSGPPSYSWDPGSRSVPGRNDRKASQGKFSRWEDTALSEKDFSALATQAAEALDRNKRMLATAADRRRMGL